jgi:integrase
VRKDILKSIAVGLALAGLLQVKPDAGIGDFRLHDLRNTFATRLADRGAPLSVIRDLPGQKSLKMARHYTHAVVETKAVAVQVLCAGGGADRLNFVSTTARRPREAAAA